MVLELKEVLEDSSLDDLSLTTCDVAWITSTIYDSSDCQNETILLKSM